MSSGRVAVLGVPPAALGGSGAVTIPGGVAVTLSPAAGTDTAVPGTRAWGSPPPGPEPLGTPHSPAGPQVQQEPPSPSRSTWPWGHRQRHRHRHPRLLPAPPEPPTHLGTAGVAEGAVGDTADPPARQALAHLAGSPPPPLAGDAPPAPLLAPRARRRVAPAGGTVTHPGDPASLPQPPASPPPPSRPADRLALR